MKVQSVEVELRAGGDSSEKLGWSAGYTAKIEKHEQRKNLRVLSSESFVH